MTPAVAKPDRARRFLGETVKQRSPFPHTIVSELTNEWIGYEPTAEAFQHEGYEARDGHVQRLGHVDQRLAFRSCARRWQIEFGQNS